MFWASSFLSFTPSFKYCCVNSFKISSDFCGTGPIKLTSINIPLLGGNETAMLLSKPETTLERFLNKILMVDFELTPAFALITTSPKGKVIGVPKRYWVAEFSNLKLLFPTGINV